MTDSSSIVKIVSWNIARRAKCWERLIDMGADVALLQEASEPRAELADRIDVDPAPWRTAGGDCDPPRAWRTAVVRLSNRVQVEWIEAKSIDAAGSGELAVSCLGTLAAAHVTAPGSDPFVCVSMYSLLDETTRFHWQQLDRLGRVRPSHRVRSVSTHRAREPPPHCGCRRSQIFCTGMETMATPIGPNATRPCSRE